jgi:hypothetical protein
MPTTTYSSEEYERLQRKAGELAARLSVLETMQPAWVMDHWSVTAALTSIWKELGAKNQTEAMIALKKLKS